MIKMPKLKLMMLAGSLGLLLAGCGGTSSGFFLKGHLRTVAVLDFEQEGFLGGEKLGSFAADELTTALFLKKKFEVVDRAQVKAGVLAKNLAITAMKTSEVVALGKALNTDYFIFGKLCRLDEQDFDSEKSRDVNLQISFRLISTQDGAVAGIVSAREKGKTEMRKFISEVISRMAIAVKLKS